MNVTQEIQSEGYEYTNTGKVTHIYTFQKFYSDYFKSFYSFLDKTQLMRSNKSYVQVSKYSPSFSLVP